MQNRREKRTVLKSLRRNKMRIRFKPWARPELEACKFYIDNPEEYKGKWETLFKNKAPTIVEASVFLYLKNYSTINFFAFGSV